MNLYGLRKIHGKIHEKLIYIRNRIAYIKYIKFPFGKKAYVVGTPDYTNLGDSAIAIAEMSFLNNCGFTKNRVKELTQNEYKLLKGKSTYISHKSPVCGIGGGNMGNVWRGEEIFRYGLLDDFSDNNIIIFPQTVHFIDCEEKKADIDKSVKYYNGKNRLTLVAREKVSYEFMKAMYPETEILLTPDIVLFADMNTFGVESHKRQGALLCLRSDIEKSLSDDECIKIEKLMKKNNLYIKKTDMYSNVEITKDNRFDCVRSKMEEFVKSNLVITDRLHGMVFAAITGTPCIVLSNYNHKVKGTYEWIKYLPYIKYAENVSDVEKYIPELLAMDNCKYDNAPLRPYFDKLAEVVKSKC